MPSAPQLAAAPSVGPGTHWIVVQASDATAR